MTTSDGYGDFYSGGAVPRPTPATPPTVAPAVARPAAGSAVPETVTAAAVLLLMAAVAAVWLGLSLLSVQGAVSSNGGPIVGGITWRGLLLLANGVGNVALAYFVRQGLPAARIVTAVICAGWTLDWTYHATQTSSAFSSLSALPVGGLGSISTMATFGVLLLAGWAATTAGLLWTASANAHFRR